MLLITELASRVSPDFVRLEPDLVSRRIRSRRSGVRFGLTPALRDPLCWPPVAREF